MICNTCKAEIHKKEGYMICYKDFEQIFLCHICKAAIIGKNKKLGENNDF